MREPVILEAKKLWPNEELRIELSGYRAQTYISLRRWFAVGADFRPGKGLSVHARHIPLLRIALQRAEAEALRRGLLDEESYQSCGLPLPPELG